MTISAYQTLYESAVAFGMRKALQAEQGRSELLARIDQLEVRARQGAARVCGTAVEFKIGLMSS